MEFLKYLIKTPDFASGLAACAVLLSLWSMYLTRISTGLNAAALEETRKNTSRVATAEIEQKRYELLKAISEECSLVLDQIASLGAIKAEFDASHQVVKQLMSSHADLFNVNLPNLEKYLTELEHRRVGAKIWTVEKGIPELLEMMADQDHALVYTRHSAKCTESVIAEFKSKLLQAQNYQKGATR